MRRRRFIALAGATLAAVPFATRAQQPGHVYRIAIAHPTRPVDSMNEAASPRFIGAFIGELRRLGFVEGQNLVIERYSGEGKAELYVALTEKIVAATPDAVFVMGELAQSFKSATSSVPIVAVPNDPLASGLVANLAHPGGNITGVTADAGAEIAGKRLQLLLQAIPKAKRIAYLSRRAGWKEENPGRPATASRIAATAAGVTLVPVLLDTPLTEPEYRRAFAEIARNRIDALLLEADAEHYPWATMIAGLAAEGRLAGLYPDRSFADAGGMMSYGVDFPDLFRHAGAEVAEILRGVKPGDIPFYRAKVYELVINLGTAKALGIEIPALLQAGADLIE